MRSIYSGISGLKNMQTGMDIIGNNIANVNTPGYKASRISFQDILSQTVQGASAATSSRGGTNPMQVGLGMAVASTDTIFTDGTPTPTGKPTDLAISGTGFFILSDGATQMYTRAGGFDFDTEGNYVLPGTGFKVMGWQADSNGMINATGQVQDLVSPVGKAMAAKVSTQITYGDNLSADAAIGSTVPAYKDVYDSLGTAHKITTDYYKVDNNTWLAKTSVSDPTVSAATGVANDMQVLKFNSDGTYQTALQATAANQKIDLSISQLNSTSGSITTQNWSLNDNGTVHNYNMAIKNTAGSYGYTITDTVNGAVIGTATGTLAYTAAAGSVPASYTDTLTSSTLTLPVNFLSGVTALAPAPGVATVSGEVATNINVAALQLDSTAGAAHTQNFTTIVNGKPQVYAMTVTTPSTGQNSWTYSISQVGVTGATPTTGTITYDGTNYTGFPTSIGGAPVNQTAAEVIAFNSNSKSPAIGGFLAAQTVDYYTTAPVANYNVQFTGGSDAMTLNFDSTKLSQFSGKSTIQATDQNGYAAGTLSTTAINTSGVLVGTFTNGQTQNLAQVALAIFNNPGGLIRSGSNMFTESTNSGSPQVGASGSGGRGTFSPGNLEGSNVDLAQQFSDMIITERAYQANSKIITTSDEMLQDLNNLKR
jgi:flagellar hook protein FlgE